MRSSGLQDRAAAIDALLGVARRETLVLALADGAADHDGAAVAAARLRWAIGTVRQLIAAVEHAPWIEPHIRQLDQVANRAQRWLATEPTRSSREIGELVDRLFARPGRRGPGIDAAHASLVDHDLDDLDLEGSRWRHATLSHCTLRHARLIDARLDGAVFSDCDLRGADLQIVRSPSAAALDGARFVRCDLRETRWAGRELGGASFLDCQLLGAHGAPGLAGTTS
jgi:pentapeptide repeat protein